MATSHGVLTARPGAERIQPDRIPHRQPPARRHFANRLAAGRFARVAAWPAIFLLAYAFGLAGAAGAIGIVDQRDAVLFGLHDSQVYDDYADWLAGRNPRFPAFRIRQRPCLFPLLLLSRGWLGNDGFILLQIGLSIGTMALIYAAVWLLTRSVCWALAATSLPATNVTMALCPFYALTEPLGFFLVAGSACAVVACLQRPESLARRTLALGVLSLLVINKAVAGPFLLLFLVWTAIGELRRGSWRSWRAISRSVARVALPCLALAPIAVQLALTAAAIGRPVISTAGGDNLCSRVYPRAYALVQGAEDYGQNRAHWMAEAARAAPRPADRMTYMRAHPLATARAFGTMLLNCNLRAGSPLALGPGGMFRDSFVARKAYALSLHMNRAYLLGHIAAIVGIGAVLLRRRRFPAGLTLLVALAWSLLLPSGLVDYQGDRIAALAVPAWTVAYAGLAASVLTPAPSRPARRA